MTAPYSMPRKHFILRFIFAASLFLGLFACKQNALYERMHNIPEAKWQRTFIPTFSFNISDSNAFYRVYVVVRHTNKYPYRNVWMNVGIQQPQDSMRVQQFELPLAASDKWLGVGMDDVFERRVLLFPRPVKFPHAGEVKFTLQHTMRLDPLPELLQVGIRVEPVATVQP